MIDLMPQRRFGVRFCTEEGQIQEYKLLTSWNLKAAYLAATACDLSMIIRMFGFLPSFSLQLGEISVGSAVRRSIVRG